MCVYMYMYILHKQMNGIDSVLEQFAKASTVHHRCSLLPVFSRDHSAHCKKIGSEIARECREGEGDDAAAVQNAEGQVGKPGEIGI